MIEEVDRQILLAVARDAIEAVVTGRSFQPRAVSGELARPAAVFVSLHTGGALRGCIGHLQLDAPLVNSVAHCARLACTSDPRFPAVTDVEVAMLDVEISILGPFERVSSLEEIVIGRHGLSIDHQRRSGLLLPQVAVEYGWTAAMFVERTCQKAGLPRDAWTRGAMLWRFEADVFGER